jgi:hypothetical protein
MCYQYQRVYFLTILHIIGQYNIAKKIIVSLNCELVHISLILRAYECSSKNHQLIVQLIN